jgi:hypothetical protein
MKYIAPRGDNFYYIEVWTLEDLRNQKISNILDSTEILPKFLNGSSNRLVILDSLEFSNFWKTKEFAQKRIDTLKLRKKDKNTYIIKCLSREEFINFIPDKINDEISDSKKMFWRINFDLKKREINYLKKINKRDFSSEYIVDGKDSNV